MRQMQELTIEETIERIGQLIDHGEGDVRRLDHIRESLRNNKILFNTDGCQACRGVDDVVLTLTALKPL